MKSGEFGDLNGRKGSKKELLTRPLRKALAHDQGGVGGRESNCGGRVMPAHDPILTGRFIALQLANLGREWTANAAKKMPVATGDIREIIDQPVFIPLEQLFRVYGKIFRLSFGPKNFVIISDPGYAKQASCSQPCHVPVDVLHLL